LWRNVSKTFQSRYAGEKSVEVELFTWERLDYVDRIKSLFRQKYLFAQFKIKKYLCPTFTEYFGHNTIDKNENSGTNKGNN
jgi:hypothetical protein